MPLELLDLLRLNGFDPSISTKLVRHKEDRYPVTMLLRNNGLELYQRYQKDNVFHRIQQIVSFSGLPNNRAAFYGVYKVIGHHPAAKGQVLSKCLWSKQLRAESTFFYDLERDDRFNEFRDRIIIDWRGPRTWAQHLRSTAVFEVLPPGRKLDPFDDFLEFSLTYSQLKDLFANEEAHRDWKIPLSNVAGIYLILATKTGDLYIGSAYGESGIWGRWRQYAISGHGGNVKLKSLLKADPSYPEFFRFSVLQILPRTMTRNKVLDIEAKYMDKLGTRATGLNS